MNDPLEYRSYTGFSGVNIVSVTSKHKIIIKSIVFNYIDGVMLVIHELSFSLICSIQTIELSALRDDGLEAWSLKLFVNDVYWLKDNFFGFSVVGDIVERMTRS